MVHTFNYFARPTDARPSFTCTLSSQRCTRRSRGGGRCKQRVILGQPVCWVHLLRDFKLRVAPSRIPNAGLGLFASATAAVRHPPVRRAEHRIFRAGDPVVEYTGEVLTPAQFDVRYPHRNGPYVLGEVGSSMVDAACRRGVGSLANSHRNQDRCNAAFALIGGRPWIRATRAIYDGQEILVDYGPDYLWDSNRDRHETR